MRKIPSFQQQIFTDGVTYEKRYINGYSWWDEDVSVKRIFMREYCVRVYAPCNFPIIQKPVDILHHDNNYYYSLTTFRRRGSVGSKWPLRSVVEEMAKLLAQIHSLPFNIQRFGSLADATIDTQQRNFVSKWWPFVEHAPVFLHGDFHMDNVLFSRRRGGKLQVSALLDFEESAYGDPMWDVAEFCRSIYFRRDLSDRQKGKYIGLFIQTYEAYTNRQVTQTLQWMNLIADRNKAFNKRLPSSFQRVNEQYIQSI